MLYFHALPTVPPRCNSVMAFGRDSRDAAGCKLHSARQLCGFPLCPSCEVAVGGGGGSVVIVIRASGAVGWFFRKRMFGKGIVCLKQQ